MQGKEEDKDREEQPYLLLKDEYWLTAGQAAALVKLNNGRPYTAKNMSSLARNRGLTTYKLGREVLYKLTEVDAVRLGRKTGPKPKDESQVKPVARRVRKHRATHPRVYKSKGAASTAE